MLLKLPFFCAGNISEGGLVKARLSPGSAWEKTQPNTGETPLELRRS